MSLYVPITSVPTVVGRSLLVRVLFKQNPFRLVQLTGKVSGATQVRVHLLHEASMCFDDVCTRWREAKSQHFPGFPLGERCRNRRRGRRWGRAAKPTRCPPEDDRGQDQKENKLGHGLAMSSREKQQLE